jgi:hypothetical protein
VRLPLWLPQNLRSINSLYEFFPVHTHRTLVAAMPAGHEQARDATPAHYAERHRADRFVILGDASKLRANRERNQVVAAGDYACSIRSSSSS